MIRVTLAEARRTLGDVVDRVRYRGERVVLTANGKPAAVVPIEILQLLQDLENADDVRAVRRALKEHKAKGGATPVAQSLVGREL